MSLKDVRPATIRKVIRYLEDELELSVYGRCIDTDDGLRYDGLRDYSADEGVALRSLYLRAEALS